VSPIDVTFVKGDHKTRGTPTTDELRVVAPTFATHRYVGVGLVPTLSEAGSRVAVRVAVRPTTRPRHPDDGRFQSGR